MKKPEWLFAVNAVYIFTLVMFAIFAGDIQYNRDALLFVILAFIYIVMSNYIGAVVIERQEKWSSKKQPKSS